MRPEFEIPTSTNKECIKLQEHYVSTLLDKLGHKYIVASKISQENISKVFLQECIELNTSLKVVCSLSPFTGENARVSKLEEIQNALPKLNNDLKQFKITAENRVIINDILKILIAIREIYLKKHEQAIKDKNGLNHFDKKALDILDRRLKQNFLFIADIPKEMIESLTSKLNAHLKPPTSIATETKCEIGTQTMPEETWGIYSSFCSMFNYAGSLIPSWPSSFRKIDDGVSETEEKKITP